MQFKKTAQVVLIAMGLLSMAGCTHTKKNMDASGGSYDDPYSNAEASGVAAGSRYSAASGANHGAGKDVFYFEFDKSTVNDSDKPAIYAKADYLIANPNSKIILEGHTDPRGSREYNVGLGERRANSIAEILKARGVNPSQIRMVSYGAERLAAGGHTESDYQMDRRAIFARIQG